MSKELKSAGNCGLDIFKNKFYRKSQPATIPETELNKLKHSYCFLMSWGEKQPHETKLVI